MSLIGQVILKILPPNYVLILMHNRACFWKPFDQIWLEEVIFNQILNFKTAS